MIFDAHAHVYPGAGGFWQRGSSVESLIAAMDRAGVARAAVVAIEPDLPVAGVLAAAAAHPDRLVAIGSVDPRRDDAIEGLERQVRELGVRAIKLHPRLQQIRFEDVERVTPLARRCGALGVPLMVCSFAGGADLFRGRTIELCHELAGAAPDTAIVLAHAGGYRPLDALMALKARPNLYVDLSFTPIYFAGSSVLLDLAYLVRRSNPERVLFGSDFPEAPIDETLAWLAAVFDQGRVSDGHRRAILYDNAARLFRVP